MHLASLFARQRNGGNMKRSDRPKQGMPRARDTRRDVNERTTLADELANESAPVDGRARQRRGPLARRAVLRRRTMQ
jgi:hypothetical protein